MSISARSGWLVVALLAAVAVFLHLPSLDAGLAADDYLQRAMLDGEYPVTRSVVDLYSFARKPGELATLMNAGIAPWWSHPELRLGMLRPLASLLLWVDHGLLDLSPRGQHVHSLLWLVGLVGSYYTLASRLLPRPAALLATAIVAFDATLVAPLSWVCNRNSLITATFTALALAAYVRWRADGWRWGAPLAFGALALALAGGEYGLGGFAYVVAWELFAARDGRRRRLAGVALAAVPTALYLAVHVALRYGAAGSIVYVSPFDSPGEFALNLVTRAPALATTELVLVPAEWLLAFLAVRSPWFLAAVAPLVLLIPLLVGTVRQAEPFRRRVLLACLAGGLFAIVPLTGTTPSIRLLMVPGLGGSVVVAAVLWDAVERMRSAEARRRAATWTRAALTALLAAAHLGYSPIYSRQASTSWRDVVGAIRQRHLDAEIDDAEVPGKEYVLINAAGDIAALIYPPWVRHLRGSPLPHRWLVLAITLHPERALRIDDRTLELTVHGGTMFEDITSQLFRSPTRPFSPGDVVRIPGLEIRIEEVSGWAPTRVRYTFGTSLDDPNRIFMLLDQGRFVRLRLPAPGGELMVPPG